MIIKIIILVGSLINKTLFSHFLDKKLFFCLSYSGNASKWSAETLTETVVKTFNNEA